MIQFPDYQIPVTQLVKILTQNFIIFLWQLKLCFHTRKQIIWMVKLVN